MMDPLAEKYYNISPYAYVANNPLKFIDPDGRTIVLRELVDLTGAGAKYNQGQVSDMTQQSLVDMMKTDAGLAFFGQFAKAGQIIGGHEFKEDGKFASHDLVFTDVSLSEMSGENPYAADGSYSLWSNGENVSVMISVNSFARGDKYSIGEAISHEIHLHGYKAGEGIRTFENGGKTALDNIKNTGQSDHTAYMNKNLSHPGYKLYNLQRQQLFKVDPKYESIFKSQEGLYDKHKK